ncbi:conserved Plasmodium protein, unknown function [Plasmodium malariae]|uniref:Clathrin adaptor domain-containing protein n=2 Tax=Plasmodium malariae TaxID=5858 RepID=A0A1D3TFR7_PLAMA|nr:conserved Plasmodium protein, unknown function [Plasmodium malariae]SCP03734.1 conserved Plasmodium protein, unknown function [Plasmodium malariae]
MPICKSKYKNAVSEDDKLLFKACTESTEYLHIYFNDLREYLYRSKKYEELNNFCYNILRNIKNPAMSRITALKVISLSLVLKARNADLRVYKEIITYAYKLLKRDQEGENKKYFSYFGHSTNQEKNAIVTESKNLLKTVKIMKLRNDSRELKFINTIFNKMEENRIEIPEGYTSSYSILLNDFKISKRDLFEMLEDEFVNHLKVDSVYTNYVRLLNQIKEKTVEFLENGEYELYCRFMDVIQIKYEQMEHNNICLMFAHVACSEMQEEEELNIRYESYVLSCPHKTNEKNEAKVTNQENSKKKNELKKSLNNIFANSSIDSEEEKEKKNNNNSDKNSSNDKNNKNNALSQSDHPFSALPSFISKKNSKDGNESRPLSKNMPISFSKFTTSFSKRFPSSNSINDENEKSSMVVPKENIKKYDSHDKEEEVKDNTNTTNFYPFGINKDIVEKRDKCKKEVIVEMGKDEDTALIREDNSKNIAKEKKKKKKETGIEKETEAGIGTRTGTELTKDNGIKENFIFPEENISNKGKGEIREKGPFKKHSSLKSVSFDIAEDEYNKLGIKNAKGEADIPGNDRIGEMACNKFNDDENKIINEFNLFLNKQKKGTDTHMGDAHKDDAHKSVKEFKNTASSESSVLWNYVISKSKFYELKEDFVNYNKFLLEKEKRGKEETLGNLLGMSKYIDIKKKKKNNNNTNKRKGRKMNPEEFNCIIDKFTKNINTDLTLRSYDYRKGPPQQDVSSYTLNANCKCAVDQTYVGEYTATTGKNESSHVSSFNKYFTANDNIFFVQKTILKNSSLLFNDDNLEISIDQNYYDINGIIKIYLKNKKFVNFYDVDIQITNKILFPLRFKFLSYEKMLCTSSTNCYEMAVKCQHMYKGFPLIKISYRMQDMFRKSIELRLPIPINKFMKSMKITKDVFDKFWNNENFNLYKKEKIINKGEMVDNESIVVDACLGDALNVCYIDDKIYLCGSYTDNSSALENYFVLVGIEVVKKKLKIICKSNNPTLSSAILFLIVLILKKHTKK